MRLLNTEGPSCPDRHYAVQPLERMNFDEFLSLIRAKRYFVLHAISAVKMLIPGKRGEHGPLSCRPDAPRTTA